MGAVLRVSLNQLSSGKSRRAQLFPLHAPPWDRSLRVQINPKPAVLFLLLTCGRVLSASQGSTVLLANATPTALLHHSTPVSVCSSGRFRNPCPNLRKHAVESRDPFLFSIIIQLRITHFSGQVCEAPCVFSPECRFHPD